MLINGVGGTGVVFNVPVTANSISSNRHGAIFNREITINEILARSAHQDVWQINTSATKPIEFIQIDENRGPDGGNANGSFTIGSNLIIDEVEHIWGHMRLRLDAMVEVDHYVYFNYTNQAENNNINPITLEGTLVVKDFMIFDVENDVFTNLAIGSYGSIGNLSADFELPFITGGDLLIITDELFANGFESFSSSTTKVDD